MAEPHFWKVQYIERTVPTGALRSLVQSSRTVPTLCAVQRNRVIENRYADNFIFD